MHYAGTGQVIPISIDKNSPIVDARIIQSGFAPIDAKFLLDTGFSSAISFDRDFVESHRFLVPAKTVRSSGATLDGDTHELVGRLTQLQVGRFLMWNALAKFTFSQDEPADSGLAGTIGGEFLRRFNVILDYGKAKLILQPNSHFADPDDTGMTGMAIVAGGRDFREFLVGSILPMSPASESGLHIGDVLITIDGKPTSNFTMEQLRQMFRINGRSYWIEATREKRKLRVRLTLRRII